MYTKDHMVESMVFLPWSRTVIPFSSLQKRYKHIKTRIDRHQHGIKDMLHPIFLPNPSPNVGVPWERPELDGPIGGIGLIL